MTEREYKRLRKEIEDRARADLAALQRVWDLTGGSAQGPHGHGELRSAVVRAVNGLDRQFSVVDVEAVILDAVPAVKSSRSSISTTLKRLHAEKQLDVVRVGSGRSATIYKKSDSWDADGGGKQEGSSMRVIK